MRRLARLYARALGLLRPEARLVAVVVAADILIAAAQFADPILLGRVVAELASPNGGGGLFALVALWGVFGLFTIGAGALVALHADRLTHRRRLAVLASAFEHMLQLPLSFHAGQHSGRLMKVMLEGANAFSGVCLPFLRDHCASLAALFIMMPLSMFVDWRLGLILVGLVALFAAMMTAVLRRTEALQSGIEQHHSAIAERAADALGNIPVVQSFTRVDAEVAALREVIGRLLAAQRPVLSWWALAAVATRASAVLTVIAILTAGVTLRLHGAIGIGQIVTFVAFATSLIGRLEQIVAFFNTLFLRAPKLRDLFDILDTEPQVCDGADAKPVGRLRGDVRFEAVSFGYEPGREAVSGLGFDVPAGTTVALVGATGSGKSTTLSLLYRAFDPTRGRITIDGTDIRAMTLVSLRRNIGVVFQEPMLFARSIADNLRVGKPDANEDELRLALQRAQAEAFVGRQPQELATMMGERGRTLSGGERQRLAIARTLLKDPPILIFDEATSALDAATERQIQAAIETASAGRTTFIIAHRLATIRHADRILVLDGGRVVETGTFAELIARGGRFRALAEAQFLASAEPQADAAFA